LSAQPKRAADAAGNYNKPLKNHNCVIRRSAAVAASRRSNPLSKSQYRTLGVPGRDRLTLEIATL